MEYFATGSPRDDIDHEQAARLLESMLAQLGSLRRVLLLPPDITRRLSGAGTLTGLLYEKLTQRGASVEILPALGTHGPMSAAQLRRMFPGIPSDRFHVHRWREDLRLLGEVPAEFVQRVSEGRLSYPIRCELARLLFAGWDRIISIGQVVPHEVAGIANHAKNLFVGVGGQDTIHKTHFLAAVYGLERIIGRWQSPVRAVFDYMAERFARDLPLTYVLTVRGRTRSGRLVTRGLFAGDDSACFRHAARLCRQVNIELLDEPLQRAVVYLHPHEYRSTWLANKAIYRLRLALADDGELFILAPGVHSFAEDPQIDHLIRKYGYHGTAHTLRQVREHADLAENLAAAAHLIHGSTEGRFRVRYSPGGLSGAEIESVGFRYLPLESALARYDPRRLSEGPNVLPDGEQVFFVSNPGLGLWACKTNFPEESSECPETS